MKPKGALVKGLHASHGAGSRNAAWPRAIGSTRDLSEAAGVLLSASAVTLTGLLLKATLCGR